MPRPTHSALLALLLVLLAISNVLAARHRPPRPRPADPVQFGAVIGGQTRADTVYVLGGPGRWDGRFEDPDGQPNWHGWTHRDLTYDDGEYWTISDHLPLSGPYSMWCGTIYDDGPGYGNDWDQRLVFTHAATLPIDVSTIHWTGLLRTDTEPAYDFVHLEVNRGGEWEVLASYDGQQEVAIDQHVVLAGDDHVGDEHDLIQLGVRFRSDGAWSDEDGLFTSEGACWLDELAVEVNGELVSLEDFDDQDPGPWRYTIPPGVGDFAQLWVGLHDIDPCVENRSAQVAFIDDGLVVPGTGGTMCQTWCYGPNGYIVNNTGGLMGPDHHLMNRVESPVCEWPAGYDMVELRWDLYRHEELGSFNVWPGVFHGWGFRSATSPEALAATNYRDRDSGFHYGGPDYIRRHEWVSDFLEPGCTHVQMKFHVYEYGWVFGWVGTDGTPAPYFDNAAIVAWRSDGPVISGRAIDWFQDSFPASGTLDLVDLGANSVRLDAARNIASDSHFMNDPGDSAWFDAYSPRTEEHALSARPLVHVRLRANPLFDPYRVNPPSLTLTPGYFADGWSLVEGTVVADSCFNQGGSWVEHRWTVDLPDSHFFYPGDVLHWYAEARDEVAGDVGVAILPADTSGFASFVHDLRFPVDFVVRALPTLTDAAGAQPPVLFWNDATGRGGDDEWRSALRQLGYQPGADYDLYATNAPSSGVGNGLGGRATAAQLAGYTTLLYSCGDLAWNLLSNGDFDDDPSDDIAVVSDWLALGGRHALFTGDSFVEGLLEAGPAGEAFLAEYLPVELVDDDLRELVGQQATPHAVPLVGNGVVERVGEWVAYGGCPRLRDFDALIPAAGTVALAEYTDTAGNPGVYPYAAALLHHHVGRDARIVLVPCDLMSVHNARGWVPPSGYEGIAARALLLEDVLGYFGEAGGSPPVASPAPAARLRVAAHPNPFNPRVVFTLELPRAGELRLAVHDLRGALVSELVSGRLAAGRHEIAWDGRDANDRPVASGVYFAEARMADEAVVSRVVLIR